MLKGPDAFGRTHAASVRDTDRRAGTIKKGDSDPEGKITSLQKMLQERDATILQLRDEIAGMKVKTLFISLLCMLISFLGYRGLY